MERLLRAAGAVAAPGAQAIDAGCGDGRVSRRLAEYGFQVLAIDREAHSDWAPSNHIRFEQADLRTYPEHAAAALVCLSGVAHYFADAEETASVMGRWANFIAEGGRLITNWICDEIPYPGGGAHLPTVSDVEATLRGAGLRQMEQWVVRVDHTHPPHGGHAHAICYGVWHRD